MSRKCSICHQTGHNSRTCPKAIPQSPASSPEVATQKIIKKSKNASTASSSAIQEPPKATASSKSTPPPPPSPDTENRLFAEEIAEDLKDDSILAEVLDFSLPLTDDGKDEDYVPSPDEKASDPDMPALVEINTDNSSASASEIPQKTSKTKKKSSSSPPIRVYRDKPASKAQPKKATSFSIPIAPPKIAKSSSKPTLHPKIQVPLMPGSWRQPRAFRHARTEAPNLRNFPPNASNHWTRARPVQPRAPQFPRPSLRHPLATIQHNVPPQFRLPQGNTNQFNPYYIPPHGLPLPTSTPSHLHQASSPPRFNQTPATQHPASPAVSSPRTPQGPVHSNCTLDESLGIIRPSPQAIAQMQDLGLKIAYAVAWSNGGGVFLSRQEAEISKTTAAAANSNPRPIHPVHSGSCSLSQIVELASSWVISNMTPLSAAAATTPNAPGNAPPISLNSPSHTPATAPPATGTPTQNTSQQNPKTQISSHSNHLHHSLKSLAISSPPAPIQKQMSTPPPVSSSKMKLLSADEWSFSQEDILVRKCLLNKKLETISIAQRTPDPNRLQYLAAPGSTKGIIISGPDSTLQNMVIDPVTGSISLKPKHLPTLKLLDFPTFLSLMFRAIDMALRLGSSEGNAAANAVRTLIRDLTRQYESLSWSKAPDQLWMYNAYLRWTHMIQTRILFIGFNSEQAFLTEARNRCSMHPTLSPHTPRTNLIHTTSKTPQNNTNNNTTISQHNTQKLSSHWFICPCCATPNDHFSPACPSQAKGAKPIPKYIQDATMNAIKSAPITQAARTNLIRMASSLYAKHDKISL